MTLGTVVSLQPFRSGMENGVRPAVQDQFMGVITRGAIV